LTRLRLLSKNLDLLLHLGSAHQILCGFCNAVCSNRGVELDSWVRCIATWEICQAKVCKQYLVAWISKGGSKFDKM
jgi:hypothetical protein